jgi:hypothetical protein
MPILSASYRTDIPAHFAAWFRKRLAAGYCVVPAPHTGVALRVDLAPSAVDGIVFWTKYASPEFREALADLRSLGIPFIVQQTATWYPTHLEPYHGQ